jgi:hypothetical protein
MTAEGVKSIVPEFRRRREACEDEHLSFLTRWATIPGYRAINAMVRSRRMDAFANNVRGECPSTSLLSRNDEGDSTLGRKLEIGY